VKHHEMGLKMGKGVLDGHGAGEQIQFTLLFFYIKKIYQDKFLLF
jgi:hypothetical protein